MLYSLKSFISKHMKYHFLLKTSLGSSLTAPTPACCVALNVGKCTLFLLFASAATTPHQLLYLLLWGRCSPIAVHPFATLVVQSICGFFPPVWFIVAALLLRSNAAKPPLIFTCCSCDFYVHCSVLVICPDSC